MATLDYYEQKTEQRIDDMIYYLRQLYPGQTITRDFSMKNAPLWKIARNGNGTQRVIDWCRNEIEKKRLCRA